MANYKVTDAQLEAIADQIRIMQVDQIIEGKLTIEEDGSPSYVDARYMFLSSIGNDDILLIASFYAMDAGTYEFTFRYYFGSTTGFGEPFTKSFTVEAAGSTDITFSILREEVPENAMALVIDSSQVNHAYFLRRYAFPDGFLTALRAVQTLDNSTQDAGATAADIVQGKTAYVKGKKITGTGKSYFEEGSGNYTKSSAIMMIKNNQYTAGNAFGNAIAMPTDKLVAKKAELTDYSFLAGNATITGHLQILAVNTKTVGGVEYVDSIQLGHKENWTAPGNGQVSVTFYDLDWVMAKFGTPT